MTNPTSNFGWQMPTSTDLVTDLPADFEVFGQAVDTSLADLKGGTTGQVLSKASNTNMDFTWVTTDDANAIQNSIVDAKGDIVAASANDTPARLAVGNNGETLVADSSTSTGLRYGANFAAGKNKIINGDFNIWQRGTSFTNPTAGAFLSDRFLIDYSSGTVNCVVSQQTFTPGAAPVAGYESQYFLRVSQSAATASKNIYLRHKIEDVRSLAGQTATFSFWAKANASKTLNIAFYQYFGTGGSAGVSFTGTPTTASVTTSWQRFTVTVNVPSVSGKTIGASSWLLAEMYYDSNAIQDLDFWGWQLEAGSVATAFQTATGTLQGELAACQRYYQRVSASGATGNYSPMNISGFTSSTTNAYFQYQPFVPFRSAPSSVDFSTLLLRDTANSSYSISAVTLTDAQATSLGGNLTVSGATSGRWVQVLANNSTSAYLGFSAEL